MSTRQPLPISLTELATDIVKAVHSVYLSLPYHRYADLAEPSDLRRDQPRVKQGYYLERARARFTSRAQHWVLHPAVVKAAEIARPVNPQLLVLEFPHRSDSDPSRLAYTKDWRGWESDKQLITSIGKYLKRHFPELYDHEIRDIVALTAISQTMDITYDLDMMVHIVNHGPESCMNWGGKGRENWLHPYNAYDPSLGWGMAYRKTDGAYVGRCLVNTDLDGYKAFVRSFCTSESGYSNSDAALEAWLREQGFESLDSWGGAKLRVVKDDNRNYLRFVAPYLDGECQEASFIDDDTLVICARGEYCLTNTDGSPSTSTACTCDCCGEVVDEDDSTVIDDEHVCDSCLRNSYYYGVVSRYRDTGYIYEGNAVYVDDTDTWYHEDIVRYFALYSEHYDAHVDIDAAVTVKTSRGTDVYRYDDDDIVLCYNGDHRLREDCVLCDDGKWRPADECVECADGEWREAGKWRPAGEYVEVYDIKTGNMEWRQLTDQIVCVDDVFHPIENVLYDATTDTYVVTHVYDISPDNGGFATLASAFQSSLYSTISN